MPIPTDRRARIARRVVPGSTLLRAWPLAGGISAAMTALEIAAPGGAQCTAGERRTVIVRQTSSVGDPRAAGREVHVLRIARDRGLAVPAPLYFDASGQILSSPFLVLEYVEGDMAFVAADRIAVAHQMAAHLARIHQVDGADPALAFLPCQAETYAARLRQRSRRAPALLDASLREGEILEALAFCWPLPPNNAPSLLHGDFWRGNVLWRQGRVAAIIDWEDAQVGEPLSDLAIARLDLAWILGRDAMEAFTERYRALVDIDDTHLPYWGLAAAMRLLRMSEGHFAE